jgi:hypothetical protein
MQCNIEHSISIKMNGYEWKPKVQSVDGKWYVAITKIDFKLCRLLTGEKMTHHRGGGEDDGVHLQVESMRLLFEQRADACTTAIQAALHVEGENNKKRKALRRIARPSDLDMAPRTVDIDLPAVDKPDLKIASVSVSILFEGIRTRTLWAEATDDFFLYMSRRVQWDLQHGRTCRRKKADGEEDVDNEGDGEVAEDHVIDA